MPATPPEQPPRRARGFHSAGSLVAPKLAAAARKRGFLEARLLTDWTAIVGPEIAGAAKPVKMSRPRQGGGHGGGTLTIEADRGRGPEVQMMLPTLKARVNAALGWPAVASIRVTQGIRGFAEPQAPLDPPPPPPAPAPEALAPLLEELSSIGDDGLRGALETLARNVLSRRLGKDNPRGAE